jgi:alanine-synthesizing transaminase
MEVGVELYSMTKGHSMAGWRVGFMAGNPEIVSALAKLKSYLDYGTFQPIQVAAAAALNEGDEFVDGVNDVYRQRRDALISGLSDVGWAVDPPEATMFVWAKIPDAYRDMESLDFSIHVLEKAGVAVSPGLGFGTAGEGHVRFALVEEADRITEAAHRIGKALGRL